uniref:Uncharacterized protein n=1 Tax=Mus musculus TaxID=10090 RepID=Q3TAP3_MOUSE|nr:unnamed protein product [Mus musculus]
MQTPGCGFSPSKAQAHCATPLCIYLNQMFKRGNSRHPTSGGVEPLLQCFTDNGGPERFCAKAPLHSFLFCSTFCQSQNQPFGPRSCDPLLSKEYGSLMRTLQRITVGKSNKTL